MNTKSPIAIFTYKRLNTLKLSIDSLKKCDNSKNSVLYVFSDGPKKEADIQDVEKVRAFINTISGFKKVIIRFSDLNKGLAPSIINGVSDILRTNKSVIVLEDDLVVSTNFLNYMNQALNNYEKNANVFSVSGYTVPIKKPKDYGYDNYFTLRGSSWGWGTWSNRWESIDWEILDYEDFLKDKEKQKQFNKMGSDMCKMLSDQKKGKINSWAIRWCYNQFKTQQFTVFPMLSKVNNVGFGAGATHTSEENKRFDTPLDLTDKHIFSFNPNPKLEGTFIKQFVSKYSIKTRAFYKLKKIFNL